MFQRFLTALLVVPVLLAVSCSKKNGEPEPQPSGKLVLTIDHQVNGNPLRKNELIYTNAAGNQYMVTEVMYFISDFTCYRSDGDSVRIEKWKDIFYVDDNIAATKTIPFFDPIPAGHYDSIGFVFGITGAKNQSFMYVNPPEVNMAWPQVLGGGYHYMMINGRWKDLQGLIQPFDFHLGIGQLYHGTTHNTDSIYAFVQNWFRVSLPNSGFSLNEGDTLALRLTMNIKNWFETPNVFDFNYWGGAIMQNQEAMQAARENGWDVFSIRPAKKDQ